MDGTNKKRHDLGAGYCATTYTAPDGTQRVAIATHSLGFGMPGRVLWDGDADTLRRVMDETARERSNG